MRAKLRNKLQIQILKFPPAEKKNRRVGSTFARLRDSSLDEEQKQPQLKELMLGK